MAQNNADAELETEVKELLSRCGSSGGKVVYAEATQIRITDIPHSAGHMLPGGMSLLSLLGDHWDDWNIDYVENGNTIMYGSKPDKDVVITRTA